MTEATDSCMRAVGSVERVRGSLAHEGRPAAPPGFRTLYESATSRPRASLPVMAPIGLLPRQVQRMRQVRTSRTNISSSCLYSSSLPGRRCIHVRSHQRYSSSNCAQVGMAPRHGPRELGLEELSQDREGRVQHHVVEIVELAGLQSWDGQDERFVRALHAERVARLGTPGGVLLAPGELGQHLGVLLGERPLAP